MTLLWKNIFMKTVVNKNYIIMLVILSSSLAKATSQIIETVPANHRPQFKPDVSISSRNGVSSGRIFVPASNSVANVASVPNVAMSSLILESHHEVPPTPVTRFAVAPTVPVVPPSTSLEKLASAVHANPVLAALLISSLLNVKPTPHPVAYNTPEHLPPDPYVALLLSHYGRYIPRLKFSGHGLYGYIAANNIHNTKPFGAYKIYEDSR